METKERFQIRGGVYCILMQGGKVFLLRRANTGWSDGQMTIPAGHLEEFETPRVGALREAKEEAGVEVALEDLKFVHAMLRKSEVDTYADFIFLAEKWVGEPHNAEIAKSDFAEWYPLDQLPGNTAPYIRHILENVREGKLYSEFGWS